MHADLDLPAPDSPCDPINLHVQGWIFAGEYQAKIAAIDYHLLAIAMT
jgi:hypothetical protein